MGNLYGIALDKVSERLAHKNRLYLLLSGGIDSTYIMLSFVKNNVNFENIHFLNNYNIVGGTETYKFENFLSKELSDMYDIEIEFIEKLNPKKISMEKLILKITDKQPLVSGSGLDHCYGVFGRKADWDSSFGEDFRSFHPFVDKFFKTIPNRIPIVRKGYVFSKGRTHSKKVIYIADQPEMFDCFKNYDTNVKDIVFQKKLTYDYVKNELGYSYYTLCRKVYRKHKSEFKPFFLRLIEGYIKSFKEPVKAKYKDGKLCIFVCGTCGNKWYSNKDGCIDCSEKNWKLIR